VDVVVDAGESSYEDVFATVSGSLASDLPDVGVTLVAQWPAAAMHLADVSAKDRAVLDDPLLDLRLIQAEFKDDGRVGLMRSVAATSTPAPFRLVCPAGLVPTAEAIRRLVELADAGRYGLVLLAFPRGNYLRIARLERTEAIARAGFLADPGEDTADVMDQIFGTHWLDGSEWALVSASNFRRTPSPAQLQAEIDRLSQVVEKRKRDLDRREAEIELLTRAMANPRRRPRLQQLLRALRLPLPSGDARTKTGGSHV
jgi:hypothetical protein